MSAAVAPIGGLRAAAGPVGSAPSAARPGLAAGLAWGGAALGAWAAYLALARAGVAGGGLLPVDFLPLRFAPAVLVFLPWLLAGGRWRTLGGVGWARGLALAALAGPGFILLGAGGYRLAPLAHGAVLQPAAVTLGTFALAWLALRERPGRAHLLGAALVLGGLALVSGGGGAASGPRAWVGDLMFAAAGLLWAGFTVLVRRWGVGAVPAAAAVAAVSALAALPPYLAFVGLDRIAALPSGALAAQVLVQGVGSGALAVVAFGKAVALLGPARAALLPALVPAAAVLVGVPLLGEYPNAWQVAGLLLATGGLGAALRR